MDAKEFIELLNNHEKVKNKSVEELKKLSLEYPYSQPVQLLYAIRLSHSSEYLFNRQLGKTSILTNDRTILFDLFEREDEKQHHEPVPEVAAPSEDFKTSEEKLPEPEEQEEQMEVIRAKDEDRLKHSVIESIHDEKEKESIPEEEPKPSGPVVTDDMSLKEKVNAILEENRRLREKYEGSRKSQSLMDQRISGIREKLDKIVEKKESLKSDPEPIIEQPKAVTPPEPQKVEEVPAPQKEEEDYSADESAMLEEQEKGNEPALVDATEAPVDPIEPSPKEAQADTAQLFTIDDGLSTHSIEEVAEEEHSFVGWLQRLSEPNEEEQSAASEVVDDAEDQEEDIPFKPEPEIEERPPKTSLSEKFQLFDSFVEKLPELKKKRPEHSPPRFRIDEDELSDEESSLVTETLAKVYVKQKHYDKAIKAYEILRLKYPEKSGFFADRIFEIKKLSNS